MKKERPPQGIWLLPHKVHARINRLLDAGETYRAISDKIYDAFGHRLSQSSLARYFTGREKAREENAGFEAGGSKAKTINITASGPLTIRIICAAAPEGISSK